MTNRGGIPLRRLLHPGCQRSSFCIRCCGERSKSSNRERATGPGWWLQSCDSDRNCCRGEHGRWELGSDRKRKCLCFQRGAQFWRHEWDAPQREHHCNGRLLTRENRGPERRHEDTAGRGSHDSDGLSRVQFPRRRASASPMARIILGVFQTARAPTPMPKDAATRPTKSSVNTKHGLSLTMAKAPRGTARWILSPTSIVRTAGTTSPSDTGTGGWIERMLWWRSSGAARRSPWVATSGLSFRCHGRAASFFHLHSDASGPTLPL